MFSPRKKIGVIGAGVAGLATAIRLAAKGYEVHIYEKNEAAGGKMSQIAEMGYRFDTGPSLFTMPEWLEQLFRDCGAELTDYLSYSRLDPVCRYFYEDGTVIDAFSDPEKFAAELARKTGEQVESTLEYLEESRRIFGITGPVFLERSIHDARNYLSRDFIKAYFTLPSIRPFSKLHHVNSRFFKDPRTIQLFDRFATYNGSNPYKTPATLMVIPHLEHNLGAYFPEGGIYSIAAALEKLAVGLGVRISYRSEVDSILVRGNRAEGLAVDGEHHLFDAVVSDADIHHVYRKLLKRKNLPGRWFARERSTSALIFYWGMKGTFPALDVHNILFSGHYAEEFVHLSDKKEIIADPTVYIYISSKKVKQDAPEGRENWFVMVNAPEDTGQDWARIIDQTRDNIKARVRLMTGVEPDEWIETERVMGPGDIAVRTSSFGGALYGNSSNGLWAAFRRHPNRMPGLDGLYLAGGSVHPGGGIPLCLSSAKIVSEWIARKK